MGSRGGKVGLFAAALAALAAGLLFTLPARGGADEQLDEFLEENFERSNKKLLPGKLPRAPKREKKRSRRPKPSGPPIPEPPPHEPGPIPTDLETERDAQWREMRYHIERGEHIRKRAAKTVLHREALYFESDRDPADVLLRRTRALLEHLRRIDPDTDRSAMAAELKKRAAQVKAAPMDNPFKRRSAFDALCALRRRVAFSNPLLDFDDLLFVKRYPSGKSHMCDQFFGFHARKGGGLFALSNLWSDEPVLRDILADSTVRNGPLKDKKLTGGAFLSPDLSYDGKEILFAHTRCGRGRWSPQSSWHIFGVNVDGSDLRQLTEGKWNDFDPCFLPNGRIAFISERRGGFGRCHGRPVPTYTVHSMKPDGSDIYPISLHETNEWQPSVNNEGMIVYSRWDYVDRDSDIAHHPWVTSPDGRDARALHGNFPKFPHGREARPWMELDIRAVPESRKYVATAAPHHGQSYGSLVLLDPDMEDDDAMSQLRRITPEYDFPESQGSRRLWPYGTAWPLSETFYLCVFAPHIDARRGKGGLPKRWGIYLLDAFGNKELIYRDPDIGIRDPIPLRARPTPPELTHLTEAARPPGKDSAGEEKPKQTSDDAEAAARVAVIDVYDGLKPWPEDAKITALRVVQLFPKATAHQSRPKVGIANQSLTRGVLGTVPVERDGSAYFEAPPGKAIYFQALDEKGRAIQSMRSLTYVHPGQRLTCQGCHERRWRAPSPPKAVPLALRREPSKLKRGVEGSYPIFYPKLVQPVLDRNCVDCHAKHKTAPDLTGKPAGRWTRSYNALARYGHWYNGGNGAIRNREHGRSRTVPGQFGALEAKLMDIISGEPVKVRRGRKKHMLKHPPVKLSAEDRRRLILWLDTNTNFFGAYHETKKQQKGELVMPKIE